MDEIGTHLIPVPAEGSNVSATEAVADAWSSLQTWHPGYVDPYKQLFGFFDDFVGNMLRIQISRPVQPQFLLQVQLVW